MLTPVGHASQNTVTTEMWLICDLSLLAPLVGMVIDTNQFCQPFWHNRPLLVLAATTQVYALVAMCTPPIRHLNLLQLSDQFPQSFRFQSVGVAAAAILVYTIVVRPHALVHTLICAASGTCVLKCSRNEYTCASRWVHKRTQPLCLNCCNLLGLNSCSCNCTCLAVFEGSQ